MLKSMDQLIMVLTKEYEMYKDYLEIARKKKDVIISGHVKELDNITKIEQNMIVSMGKIDHIRTSIIGNLLMELKVEAVGSLSELTELLPSQVGAKVMDIKGKLEGIIQEIKDLNELNSSLIKQSLEYIDFNMNLIMSLETKGSTYGSKADEKDLKQRSNVFDVKI